MGYRVCEIALERPKKAARALMDALKIDRAKAQRLIDKGRVKLNGEKLSIKTEVEGILSALVFEANASGLKPFFVTPDFAVFEKPSGVLSHPNGFDCKSTLLDDARSIFGEEAQLCHRLDRETSGLVVVSRKKKAEAAIKDLFASRLAKKTYLAFVKGAIDKERLIDAPIVAGSSERNGKLGLPKVIGAVSFSRGKEARTAIEALEYFADLDATLIKALPIGGRTHQIRIHLAYIDRPILGDPLYGGGVETARSWLDRTLKREERIAKVGADRLMLHADSIDFFYQSRFFIKSRADFGKTELLAATSLS
ncbi:MAG: RluA family pseudouridine synthase [Helicobacteraceae bacterium]|jgi:23S rRNA pseudouridine1911/1915/1917 synthase|nr:RluA family pseudouridine synthase [Helicobacteraceae bacterium]